MKYLTALIVALFMGSNFAYAQTSTPPKEKPKMKLAKKKADVDKEKATKKAEKPKK